MAVAGNFMPITWLLILDKAKFETGISMSCTVFPLWEQIRLSFSWAVTWVLDVSALEQSISLDWTKLDTDCPWRRIAAHGCRLWEARVCQRCHQNMASVRKVHPWTEGRLWHSVWHLQVWSSKLPNHVSWPLPTLSVLYNTTNGGKVEQKGSSNVQLLWECSKFCRELYGSWRYETAGTKFRKIKHTKVGWFVQRTQISRNDKFSGQEQRIKFIHNIQPFEHQKNKAWVVCMVAGTVCSGVDSGRLFGMCTTTQ